MNHIASPSKSLHTRALAWALVCAFVAAGCGGESAPDEAESTSADAPQAAAEAPISDAENEAQPSEEAESNMSIEPIRVVMATSKGDIRIDLYADRTPVTVASFTNLAQRGYYDGLNFHRVIGDFMIQGGCPEGSGRGGPGYRFEDEFDPELRHDRGGILSMANAGPRTNGSQFFITHGPTPHLDGKHSVFGAVVDDSDQDVVNAIVQGDTITKVTVEGDTTALFESVKDRIDEWNAVLDAQ